ncbi:MAG: hypothetical protein JWQ74_891 [Marmoricola sp.]|nr:hypothetical protein [Marmoricola sp.]
MSPLGRFVRFLAIALCLAFLLTACAGKGPAKSADPQPTRAPSTSTDDLVSVFAANGIGTYADADADAPVQPVTDAGPTKVLRWQVETMARQVGARSGYTGNQLDDLVGERNLPVSAVIAAYLKVQPTPTAKAAAGLMGQQDYLHDADRIFYPQAVITMFVNDITRDAAARLKSGDTVQQSAYEGVASGYVVKPALVYAEDGICTHATNFLTNSINALVDTLKAAASTGFWGVLVKIWNTAVEIAGSIAKAIVKTLTEPVLALMRKAAMILAVLTSASSLLDPWSLDVNATPDPASYGIAPAAGTEIDATAHVSTAVDFKWPNDVKDCASVAGVTLPDPDSAKGSPITWKTEDPDGVTSLGKVDDKVDDTGNAHLAMTTGVESKDDAAKGSPIVSLVSVSAEVERTQIQDLSKLISAMLIDQLPPGIRSYVQLVFGPLESEINTKLAGLVTVGGLQTNVTVIHHGPTKPDDPDVPPAAAPCSAGSDLTKIPDGTWSGPISMDVKGQGGGASGFAKSAGTGTLTMIVANGKIASGKWAVDWASAGTSTMSGTSSTIKVNGHVAGKVNGSTAKPTLPGDFALTGKAYVKAGGTLVAVPIDFDGHTTEKMSLLSISCEHVSGSFVPSFNSNAGNGVSFTGNARWEGQRK